MGDQGIVASRVGEDSLGLDALRHMEELGLNIDQVQTDRLRPTGSVKAQLDGNGLPRFEIAHPVAWDLMEWTQDWQHLAKGGCCMFWIAGTAVRGKPLHHPPFSSSHVSPHRENLRR
jgi:fructokinase